MKVPDWEAQLTAVLSNAEKMPFSYGLHDCGLFAADCVLAITGKDPAAEMRGTYGTEEEADALVARYGSLLALLTEKLGEPKKGRGMEKGDIILFVLFGIEHVGVCLGEKVALVGDTGLRRVSKSFCTHYWKL